MPTGDEMLTKMVFARRVMIGHLSPFDRIPRVAKHVVHETLQLEAASHGRAKFTVTRKQPILLTDANGGADNRGFFTQRSDVKTDASLALQRGQTFIQRARLKHQTIGFDDFGQRQSGIVFRIQRSIVTQATDWSPLGRNRYCFSILHHASKSHRQRGSSGA